VNLPLKEFHLLLRAVYEQPFPKEKPETLLNELEAFAGKR
jgi:hypothetical protein